MTSGEKYPHISLNSLPKDSFVKGQPLAPAIKVKSRQEREGAAQRCASATGHESGLRHTFAQAGKPNIFKLCDVIGVLFAFARPWLTALLDRRPTKVAAIALADKIARMAWAIMAKGERHKEPAALAA